MKEESELETVEYKYKCSKCGYEWKRKILRHMGSSSECPKCGTFNPPIARRYYFEKEFTSFREL
ncbi:MAG: zinc-ribbon domain-containing protein [Candidatus Bathyarchaeia archaeon]